VSSGEPQGAPRSIVARLVVMMFLQYWALGVWAVTVYTYLDANTIPRGAAIYSEGFVGYSATAGALGALVAPVLVGWAADRYFSAQRVVALLHLLSAGALVGMLVSRTQAEFYIALVAFYQFYVPTVSLTNTIAMRQIGDSDKQFYFVRTFGTVAWIAAGLFVGWFWPTWFGESIESTRTPIAVGLVSEVVMAVYALTLPATPPSRKATGWRSLTGGAGVWRNRPLVVFLGVSLLACIPAQVYGSFLNTYMNQQNIQYAAAKQTIAQVSEVACMLAMPWLLAKFGLKTLFLLGILTWSGRYLMLALAAQQDWVSPVYLAMSVHGPSYVCIYVAGQLYIDRLAARDGRGAAQGFHALATTGLGHLAGSIAGGKAQAWLLTPTGVDPAPYRWVEFWLIPAGVAFIAAAVFVLAFHEPKSDPIDEGDVRPSDMPLNPVDAITEPVSR
jgi:nucleoside transporter